MPACGTRTWDGRSTKATVLASARAVARRRGRATPSESDVVEAVLVAAGYRIRGSDAGAPASGGPAAGDVAAVTATTTRGPIAGTPVPEDVAAQVRAGAGAPAGSTAETAKAAGGGEEAAAAGVGAGTAPGGGPPRGEPPVAAWTPRATRPTPTLDTFGRDLTAEARAGRLPALIGRETELAVVVETLCRSTKRNPALVGPAGTGKTAIVEGLAARIVVGRTSPRSCAASGSSPSPPRRSSPARACTGSSTSA